MLSLVILAFYEAFNKKHKSAKDVGDFVASLKFYPNCHVHHATTWLEMYIMFRLLGYAKPVPDKPNKAGERATVQMQLSEFKATFRGVLDRVCIDRSQVDFVDPAPLLSSTTGSRGWASRANTKRL